MARAKSINVGILVLALLASVAACAKTAGEPSSPYGVMVDLYSGRENPKVELSSRVAEEIYGDLDGRAAEFQAATAPDSPLGFRGFVVTPSTDAQPTLRVTKNSVYSIRGDEHRKLTDPQGKYYQLILEDVKARLSQDVLKALP